MSNNTIIAVDPDTEKSGIAELNTGTREMKLFNMTFPEVIRYLTKVSEEKADVIIVVEAGWKVKKSNFHVAQGRRAERVAKNVGANHETGKKIIEMARSLGLNVVEQHPLKKIWGRGGGKISHKELAAFVPGIGKTSNQETRDAALLGWCYAGFPIRIKAGMAKKKREKI